MAKKISCVPAGRPVMLLSQLTVTPLRVEDSDVYLAPMATEVQSQKKLSYVADVVNRVCVSAGFGTDLDESLVLLRGTESPETQKPRTTLLDQVRPRLFQHINPGFLQTTACAGRMRGRTSVKGTSKK